MAFNSGIVVEWRLPSSVVCGVTDCGVLTNLHNHMTKSQ